MNTTTESTSMGFAEVSTMLWRERDALSLLLFKLVEEQLIVSAGRTRWLANANEEIEFALEQLRGTEPPPRQLLLAPELVIRGSTAPAVAQADRNTPSLDTSH